MEDRRMRSPGREHASPLAALGGVDAGGQNVHVAALGRGRSPSAGHDVTVHTRRDDPVAAGAGALAQDVDNVAHVAAGPAAASCPRTTCCRTCRAFAAELRRHWAARPARRRARALLDVRRVGRRCRRPRRPRLPVLQTFHALGSVKRRHQGAADTCPPTGSTSSAGSCRDVDRRRRHLHRRGVRAAPARAAAATGSSIVPCGVDTDRVHARAARWRRATDRPRLLVARPAGRAQGSRTTRSRALARAARTPSWSSSAVRRAERAGRRPGGAAAAARSRPSAGVADRRASSPGRSPRPTCPRWLRSADVVLVRPLVRAVRHHAAGGHGLRRARGRHRRRRAGRHRGRRRHRRPGAAARPRRALGEAARRAARRRRAPRRLRAAGVQRARARYRWSRVVADTEPSTGRSAHDTVVEVAR